jgi:hypothetical protein
MHPFREQYRVTCEQFGYRSTMTVSTTEFTVACGETSCPGWQECVSIAASPKCGVPK